MRLLLAFLLTACAPCALACSFVQPSPVTFDRSLAKAGDTPPAQPTFVVDHITRGSDADKFDSCSDTGVITLTTPATAETRALAYRFKLKRGKAEDEIFFDDPVTGFENEGKFVFVFPWLDGANARQEPIDLTIEITPYRLSGQQGTSARLRIRDPGR